MSVFDLSLGLTGNTIIIACLIIIGFLLRHMLAAERFARRSDARQTPTRAIFPFGEQPLSGERSSAAFDQRTAEPPSGESIASVKGLHLSDPVESTDEELLWNKRSLDDTELILQFQPQFAMDSGKLRGLQATIAFADSIRQPATPAVPAHIPAMDNPHTDWDAKQLQEACAAMQRLAPRPSDLTLSVGVTQESIADPQFPARLSQILRQTGFSAGRLELELTGQALTHAAPDAVRTIRRLRSIGVRLALSDGGAVYAAPGRLRKLPLQAVIIEQSTIRQLTTDDGRKQLAEMIEYMKLLGYAVIAEGVESYEQLSALRESGCDYVQGCLLGQAQPEEYIRGLLSASKSDLEVPYEEQDRTGRTGSAVSRN